MRKMEVDTDCFVSDRSINNPQVSEKAKKEAEAKLATLEGKQV